MLAQISDFNFPLFHLKSFQWHESHTYVQTYCSEIRIAIHFMCTAFGIVDNSKIVSSVS